MKSYAFKFGIVVGTIGIIGCEPNKTEINFSGSKSSANTSSALQKSSGSGATALGVRSAGDLVTKELSSSEIKELISAKDTEQLTNYINKDKSGPALHKKMKELYLDSEFASNMTFTVDVYYFKNGRNGEMDWLPGKEFYYSESLKRFLIKGARKNDDGSDKPIRYSLGNFDIYPNNNEKKVYNFRNIKVVKIDKKYHEINLDQNNIVYQLTVTHLNKILGLNFIMNDRAGAEGGKFSVSSDGWKYFSIDEFENFRKTYESEYNKELSFYIEPYRALYFKDDGKLATKNAKSGMSIEELHRNMKEKPGNVRVYETLDDKKYYSSWYQLTPYIMVAIDEGDKKFKLVYKDTDGNDKTYKTFSFEDVKNHLKSLEYFYLCEDYLMNAPMKIHGASKKYTPDELYNAIEDGDKFLLEGKQLSVKDSSFIAGDNIITVKKLYSSWIGKY